MIFFLINRVLCYPKGQNPVKYFLSLSFMSSGGISEERSPSLYLSPMGWTLLDRLLCEEATLHSFLLNQPLCEWGRPACSEVVWVRGHKDCPVDPTLSIGKYKGLGSRWKHEAPHWASL